MEKQFYALVIVEGMGLKVPDSTKDLFRGLQTWHLTPRDGHDESWRMLTWHHMLPGIAFLPSYFQNLGTLYFAGYGSATTSVG